MGSETLNNSNKSIIERFITLEAFSGLLLLFALLFALIVNNTPLSHYYESLTNLPIHIRIGLLVIEKPLVLWLNDGLMAIFFMLLALEMKREMIEGELSKLSQVRLPFLGAIGGIIVPAILYWAFTHHDPGMARGWPIPITTDIAFVLGLIALLGKSVPRSLRVTMVALSIVDDVLAIIIIAIVYTGKLSELSLLVAAMGIVFLFVLNRCRVENLAPYIIIGTIIWVCVLKSGIHATLAGVIVGLFVPMKGRKDSHYSPLKDLENKLHPWVAYGILPLFVFCNGGLPFADFGWAQLHSPVSLGIIFGLVVGKAVGVFLFAGACTFFGWSPMPKDANYKHLLGFACLTGIGFTMSLFLSSLAFNQTPYEDIAKQSILVASAVSCLIAVAIFKFRWRRPRESTPSVAGSCK